MCSQIWRRELYVQLREGIQDDQLAVRTLFPLSIRTPSLLWPLCECVSFDLQALSVAWLEGACYIFCMRVSSDEARAARKLLSECMSQSCTV